MTSGRGRNPAASVQARLLNLARSQRADYNQFLQRYVAERFLYRLGASEHRQRFVLKGAMLFAVWGGGLPRPTRDVDFAGFMGEDSQVLQECVRQVIGVPCPEDGVEFDADAMLVESIRDANEYHGFRVKLPAHLGQTRLQLQLDIGFGDAVVPPPSETRFPRCWSYPSPAHFTEVGEGLRRFLAPVWRAMAAGTPFLEHWPAWGPWQAEEGK